MAGVHPSASSERAADHGGQREGCRLHVPPMLKLDEDAVTAGLRELHHERDLPGPKRSRVFERVAMDERQISLPKITA